MGYAIITYLLEMVKMQLLIFGILKCPKKEGKIQIKTIGCCILLLLAAMASKMGDTIIMNMGVVLTVTTIVILLKGKKQMIFVIGGFFAIGIIDMITAGIASLILKISIEALAKMPKLSILINSFSFLLLLIFFKIKQNNINRLYSEKYSGYSLKQGILIFFGCFAFVVYLVPIIEIGTLLNEKRSVISVAVSGIIFLIICFLSLLYIQKNHLFKEKNEIYKSMILEQKVYYESILKRETETKQFRHDIKNHLLCMKQLIEEKQYLNVKDYMDDMIGKVEKLGSYRQTGNKIADIIISDIWKRTENIKLDWNGNIPKNIQMSDMDMCILLSNMLNNAVQSTSQYSGEKVITVDVKVLGTTMMIECKNPIGGVVKQKRGKLYTTKTDENNHGFGFQNMRDVVKQYGGSIHYKMGEKFDLEIILENIL